MAKKLDKKYHKNKTKKVSKKKTESETKYSGFLKLYNEKYKMLLIVPIALFVIAILSIGLKFAQTGEFIDRDVTLKGGVSLELYDSIGASNEDLENAINSNFNGASASIKTLKNADSTYRATQIVVSDVSGKDLMDFLSEKYKINFVTDSSDANYQILEAQAQFSEDFFRSLIIAIIFAFICMSTAVFIIFRAPAPSMAVIAAALSDMVVTVAILNWFNISFSSASIAGFIMLIGYSVDTDILLSTRVIKRNEGTVFERVIDAAKTGLTMTVTTLIVVTLSYFLTTSTFLKQIMMIIGIGLLVDIINTWLFNAGLLRLYKEKSKK